MSEEELEHLMQSYYDLHENYYKLKSQLQEKDKEIATLQMAIKDTLENADAIIIEQQEEIERLNNIINELEKWLKSKIDYFDKTAKDTILHEQMIIRIIYDYLQELKGSGKK